MLKPTIEYVPEYIKKNKERLEEFFKTMKKEAIVHRRIAKELIEEAKANDEKADDSKFHDGQAAMACILKVKFELLFSEELKK